MNAQNENMQQATLSEKTQQIYFQKLQKEVETAIREADQHEKGGIDIEEFKQCLINLSYLPYVNIENNDKMRKAMDHSYQNTMRNLIIQEKEFVYNLWAVLNPLNNNYLDNAMLYDVLLLLIYNVKSTIPVTAAFLSEYLENFYNEQDIDINGFANYNSGSSLGAKPFGVNSENNQTSNLNKYLAYNNQWSVEKICIEFKQIHANKVSFTQMTTRQRSPSPMASAKSLYINPNNQEDYRKYKKNTVDDHLQQLTFSPSLSTKTKDLDNQLTQRLLQEAFNNPNQKRDISAGRSRQDTSYPRAQTSHLQEHDQNTQGLSRYELLFYRHHISEQKIEKAKENLINQELKECSFKPKISSYQQSQGQNGKTYQNLQKSAKDIMGEVGTKIRVQRKLEEENNKIDKEMQECTFKPNIQSKKKATKMTDQIPKGYYEQINRLRKTAEDKKALEDKMQKKAQGDNYEKMKLLDIKPPSFLEKERQKKKLLMYVDVNITPTKTGRIGIYEGDSLKDLARNFTKTFQLNANMYHLLILQLEQHLISYKEKHGIINDDKTAFPITNQHNEKSPVDYEVPEEISENDDEEDTDSRDIGNRIIGFQSQTHYQYTEDGDEEDQIVINNNNNRHQDYYSQQVKRQMDQSADPSYEDAYVGDEQEATVSQNHKMNDTQKLNEFIQREIQKFQDNENLEGQRNKQYQDAVNYQEKNYSHKRRQ